MECAWMGLLEGGVKGAPRSLGWASGPPTATRCVFLDWTQWASGEV